MWYFPAPCGIKEYSLELKPIRIGQESGLFTFDFIIFGAAIAILALKTRTRFVFVVFTPGGGSEYPESINRTDVSRRQRHFVPGAERSKMYGKIFDSNVFFLLLLKSNLSNLIAGMSRITVI